MFGRSDNLITPEDAKRAYDILGFRHQARTVSPPPSLQLSAMLHPARLIHLSTLAHQEYQHRRRHGKLRGLTEYRLGVALGPQASTFDLTAVTQGLPNHAGREVDHTRTIIGTIHTHPWDVSQSLGDLRSLLYTNDLLGGVVTGPGRIFLLVKDPNTPAKKQSWLTQEIDLQKTSLRAASTVFRSTGLLGVLSASFDVPVHATRDPLIRAMCDRLGLIYYEGDIGTLTLHRA